MLEGINAPTQSAGDLHALPCEIRSDEANASRTSDAASSAASIGPESPRGSTDDAQPEPISTTNDARNRSIACCL
jgi:hypothetical protein